ncbi:hypothetical protein K501DRAFT_273477 [Backusella circina FSU 941]|nr:hypothetical protein K501DRAFT_273477 [Backusella circina FSU 941]
MGNREREGVKRRNLAEDIPSERVEEYVDKELNDNGELTALLVKVFDDSNDDIYRITVIDKEMINCECYYFNFYQKPCKHMYLRHRLYDNIKQNIQGTTPNPTTPETSQLDSDSLQKQQNSTVLNDIKNLLNHFSSVESQELFDEEDWEAKYTLKRRLIIRK